jgi:ABC-type multidrug transport system fused ATPase/permease subunit
MYNSFKLFPSLKKKSKYLVILSIGVSILELFSIALIIPLLSLLLDSNFNDNFFLNKFNFTLKDKNLGFIYLSAIVIFFFIVKNIFSYFFKKYIYKYCFNEQKNLRLKIFNLYLFSPYEKIILSNQSKKFSMLTELTRVSTENFLIYFIEFFSNILIGLIIFLFLLYYNFKFTIFLTIIFLISVFFLKKTVFKKIYALGKQNNLAFQNIVKFAETAINAIKELKVYLKEHLLQKEMEISSNEFSKSQINFLLIQNLPKYIIEIIIIFGILFVGSYIFIVEENITKVLITLGVYVFVSLRLAPLLNQILTCYANITNSRYSIETLLDEIDFFQSIKNNKNFQLPLEINFSKKIQINNLNFYYKNKKIFSNSDFNISKGETVILHGDSGSGKTTFVYLLLGFLRLNSKVNIDDKEYDNIKYLNLISSVSYIPQEPYMLNDTIRKNILFGSSFDEKKEQSALNDSNLSNLIKDFEDGLNTVIGDRGNKISGGQKQRISIARALYNNKNLIILDEPSTFLDKSSKDVLIETIKKLKKKYTILIITHEDIFDELADRIYTIKDHKFIENS